MTKLPKDPYQLLKLYPTIQQMILDRTLEILTPYQEIDNNIGGGSAGFISNPTEQTVVVLCEDELLEELRKVEKAVEYSFNLMRFKYDMFELHKVELDDLLHDINYYMTSK